MYFKNCTLRIQLNELLFKAIEKNMPSEGVSRCCRSIAFPLEDECHMPLSVTTESVIRAIDHTRRASDCTFSSSTRATSVSHRGAFGASECYSQPNAVESSGATSLPRFWREKNKHLVSGGRLVCSCRPIWTTSEWHHWHPPCRLKRITTEKFLPNIGWLVQVSVSMMMLAFSHRRSLYFPIIDRCTQFGMALEKMQSNTEM